jgi:hypothetical protein
MLLDIGHIVVDVWLLLLFVVVSAVAHWLPIPSSDFGAVAVVEKNHNVDVVTGDKLDS